LRTELKRMRAMETATRSVLITFSFRKKQSYSII
jgi:hypothetical protein